MMKTTLEIINGLPADIDYFLKPSVETPDLKGVLIPVADLKALITERDELKEKVRELKSKCEGCPSCDPFWAERAEYESMKRNQEELAALEDK